MSERIRTSRKNNSRTRGAACRACLLTGLVLLLAGPPVVSTAQEPALHGYLRNYTGARVGEELDFSIVQNTFDLELEYFADRAAFKVNPVFYHSATGDQQLELDLKEAYVDLYFDSVDLRMGKQQIIWGKAEGVSITDVVSPKDLSEFLLPDFDEIRIGITALKTDLYLGPTAFELVLVPVFTPNVQPEPGSIWRVTPPYPPTATVNDAEEVEMDLENGEIFGKFSYLGSLLDFELMGGYMWDDEPIPHVTSLMPMEVTPKHHRLVLGGGSFSTTVAGAVLRAEGAYYHGKRFQTDDPAEGEGVIRRDYVHYLVGSDFGLLGLDLSVQYVQKIILDYDESIASDQLDHMATFRISKTFLRETLRLELFSYVGLNEPDALLRPKIVYDLTDGLELLLGSNIFLGDSGLFGQYNGNDMVYAKVKYSF